ncbi:uncharacterized protein LOC110901469 [Helianthus annuus]|uniref:uncharacterized protein LOC110901469 n=1 Tax=Helianthus annuus TaxID=4232 RepID=UPI000B902B1C|nr:uncharacterized protein LOC110901469 [Helianthus annuus]
MGDKGEKSDSTTTNQPIPLHPVYTVTDIQKKVRMLDGSKVTYSAWVKLFHLHARGYEVLDHITSEPPPKDDPNHAQWMKIDAIVLQWIYSTLSEDYLLRVLESESTALQAWNRVKAIFHNNKGPRCAALQTKFVNLKLSACPSLEAYCQTLRDLAAQLDDVGSPVNEQSLVLQLVRGLPREYDTIGSIINREIPSWNEACEMLRGDQERQAARDGTPAPSEALAAVNPNSQPRRDGQNQTYQPRRGDGPTRFSSNPGRRGPRRDGYNSQQNGAQPGQQQYRQGSGSGSGSRGQGNRNQSRGQSPWAQHPPQTYQPTPPFWPAPYWTTPPPPCPYPTQPGWASPWPMQSPNGPQQPTTHEQSSAQAHMTDVNPLEPTELAEAFQAMALDPENPQWFMDTGATNHLTADSDSYRFL